MKLTRGFSKIISKKSLKDPCNGFLVDDTCVFGAEVFVIKSQRVIECVSVLEVTDPYKRDWKISQFSKLEKPWTSEEFTIGDHEWKIMLYPNGSGREKGRSVTMFLGLVDGKNFAPHEKVKADYCFRIKNQLHGDHCSRNSSQWFIPPSGSWGLRLLPIADVHDPAKGFVVNDCCIVEIEVSVQAVVRGAP